MQNQMQRKFRLYLITRRIFESLLPECKWKEELFTIEKRCIHAFPCQNQRCPLSLGPCAAAHPANPVAETGSAVVLDGAMAAALQGLLAAALKPVREDLSRTCLLGQHMVC